MYVGCGWPYSHGENEKEAQQFAAAVWPMSAESAMQWWNNMPAEHQKEHILKAHKEHSKDCPTCAAKTATGLTHEQAKETVKKNFII